MQLKNLKHGFTKILNICNKNWFLDTQAVETSVTSIQYGVLGSLLRRNISREWLSSALDNSDVHMFSLEVKSMKKQSKPLKLFFKETDSLFLDVLKNYFQILPIIGIDVPCGFAAYGPSTSLDNKTLNQELELDNSLLSKIECKQWLCTVFFCPTKKSSYWFNYWSRHRYRWWRKFSSIPSMFSLSDVTEPSIGDQQVSIMMEFPWGKEKLEAITLYNENFMKNCCNQINLANGSESYSSISSSIVVCEAELSLTAVAYLTNSYAEKWRNNELRNLLQLHVKLAPYKVCLSLKSEDSDCLKKLQDVARHLENDLKKCRIAVFPCLHIDSKNKDLEFSRFDEMGIPYTVILNDKALHSGIAGLRNRDTTLEEQVHITELTTKLLKYLQMKSFENEESF